MVEWLHCHALVSVSGRSNLMVAARRILFRVLTGAAAGGSLLAPGGPPVFCDLREMTYQPLAQLIVASLNHHGWTVGAIAAYSARAFAAAALCNSDIATKMRDREERTMSNNKAKATESDYRRKGVRELTDEELEIVAGGAAGANSPEEELKDQPQGVEGGPDL